MAEANETIALAKDDIYNKALVSLARYKFIMFGYYAALWSSLNKLDRQKDPNPFRDFVELARQTLS